MKRNVILIFCCFWVGSCGHKIAPTQEQLILAARHGDTNLIVDYIDDGGNVNMRLVERGPGRFTLLTHEAAARAQLPTLRLLLSRGADPVIGDSHGQTALLRLLMTGKSERTDGCLSLIATNAAIINKPDNEGLTPLMMAARYWDAGAVSFLISSGADFGMRDRNGNTALHHARNGDTVESLLRAGAPGATTNFMGETPLDIARKEGNSAVVKILEGRTQQ